MPPYSTYAEAEAALEMARLDTIGDFGEQAADDAHNDLVHAIAADCPPDIASELRRRNGVDLRIW